MNIVKTQMSLNRLQDNSDTVRWALLIGLAVFFTFLLYPTLDCFGENFVRELSQPIFEQGADDVGVVQIVICDQIDVAV